MKRAVSCLVIILLFCINAAAFAEETAPAAGPALAIDTGRAYEGMDKSYARGYLPSVSGGKATVILPLLSETAVGPLTVTVNLGNPAGSPFVYKNYEKQFRKKSYTVDGAAVECYLVRFSFELADGRVNGSYPVTLAVRGKTAGGEAFTQEFTLYVHIGDGIDPNASPPEPAPPPSSQPKLMVGSYALDRDYLEAGESATVTVTVRNTSSWQDVKNIKLSFYEESGGILPAGTGAAYCEQIAGGNSYSWSFVVTATTTAQSRPHPATITMEYEDSYGRPSSASDRIILQVRQPARLEYEEPSLPVRVTEGDTLPFTITLMNLGKSVIYNALLKFEVQGLVSGGSVLVGTILPGEAKTGSANFRAGSEMQGPVAGTLTICYEDDYGAYYEKEIPLSTTIEKKVNPAAPADDVTTALTIPVAHRIVYAAGGAVLLAVAGVLAARWLKQKKAREDDEMKL